MGARDDDEYALALDAKGAVKWETKLGPVHDWKGNTFSRGPNATPTVDGDRVYCLSSKGMLKSLDLAGKETKELAIIETYLPAGATDAEMDAAIAKAIADSGANSIKQMGAVVKAAKAALEGKTVDGKALSDRVRSRLS